MQQHQRLHKPWRSQGYAELERMMPNGRDFSFRTDEYETDRDEDEDEDGDGDAGSGPPKVAAMFHERAHRSGVSCFPVFGSRPSCLFMSFFFFSFCLLFFLFVSFFFLFVSVFFLNLFFFLSLFSSLSFFSIFYRFLLPLFCLVHLSFLSCFMMLRWADTRWLFECGQDYGR